MYTTGDGRIDRFRGRHFFLSNFYPCDFGIFIGGDEVRQVCYSVEHAYQASKTFHPLERTRIIQAGTPGEARRLGRRVRHLRADWDGVKLTVMEELLLQKFSPIDGPLAQSLIDTGTVEIVEGNTWGDTYWGVCNGIGENHLGRLLTNIRDWLQKTSA